MDELEDEIKKASDGLDDMKWMLYVCGFIALFNIGVFIYLYFKPDVVCK